MDPNVSIEELEDAVVDGDRPLRRGTARSALRQRTFRTVFLGAFASNIGTWMQNVVLGAYAFTLTHSSVFVGVIIFAQLGPALVFPMLGGVDRRPGQPQALPHRRLARAAGLLVRAGARRPSHRIRRWSSSPAPCC